MESLFAEALIGALKSSPFFLILLFILWKLNEEVKNWKEKYFQLLETKMREDKENVLLLHKVSLILEKYMNKHE